MAWLAFCCAINKMRIPALTSRCILRRSLGCHKQASLLTQVFLCIALITPLTSGHKILLKRAVDAQGDTDGSQVEFENSLAQRLLSPDSPERLHLNTVSLQARVQSLEVPAGASLGAWLEALSQLPGERLAWPRLALACHSDGTVLHCYAATSKALKGLSQRTVQPSCVGAAKWRPISLMWYCISRPDFAHIWLASNSCHNKDSIHLQGRGVLQAPVDDSQQI